MFGISDSVLDNLGLHPESTITGLQPRLHPKSPSLNSLKGGILVVVRTSLWLLWAWNEVMHGKTLAISAWQFIVIVMIMQLQLLL